MTNEVYVEEEKTQKIDTGNNVVCGACRESVKSSASRCPHCGVGYESPTGILDIIKMFMMAVLLLFGLIGVLTGGLTIWDGITQFNIVDISVGLLLLVVGVLCLAGLVKINLNTSDIINQ